MTKPEITEVIAVKRAIELTTEDLWELIYKNFPDMEVTGDNVQFSIVPVMHNDKLTSVLCSVSMATDGPIKETSHALYRKPFQRKVQEG